MERSGNIGGGARYLPGAPVITNELDPGQPSLYVPPGAIQGMPFDPNVSPIAPQTLPYYPPPPPALTLDELPTRKG